MSSTGTRYGQSVKEKAKVLRLTGLSSGAIADKLGVAKSTVSYWGITAIALSEEARQTLRNRRLKPLSPRTFGRWWISKTDPNSPVKAYTYLLKHIPSGRVYYGSRQASNPASDLFISYFSSSKRVHSLLAEDGIDSFSFEIRRTFPDYDSARRWEIMVLRRMNVISDDKWLNLSVCSPVRFSGDVERLRRERISEGMSKRWATEEYRKKKIALMTPERREALRAAGRKNKHRTKHKRISKKTSEYPMITIIRNGEEKRIHHNQLTPYRNIGWDRAPLAHLVRATDS